MKNIEHISQEDLEKIESFLSGEMTETESEAFRLKMKKDPKLESQVKQTRLMLVGIREATLHEKLNEFHNEIKSGKAQAPVRKMLPKFWIAAASAVIVVSVTMLLILNSKEENLFADYYQPDQGLMTTMGNADNNYEFNRAMVDYKSGKYKPAIERWITLFDPNSSNDTLNYFIGSSYLALEEAEKAIPYFKQVLEVNYSVFKDDATWYLGLALLKEGKKSEAIIQIEKSDNPEKHKLLSEIKN